MIIERPDRFGKENSKLENALEVIETTFNDHDQGRKAWNTFSLVPTIVTSGASYAMSRNQTLLIINKTVGSATGVTLPATPISGHVVVVKDGKGDAASNNITISPAAGNIDGAGTNVISTNHGSVVFAYNGTQWNVISTS